MPSPRLRAVPLFAAVLLPLHGQSARVAGSHADAREPAPPAVQCTLQAGPEHTVVRVIDAETLELDDGSNLRLIGALRPAPPPFVSAQASWPPDAAAISALERLTLGKRVELAFTRRRVDRWGRHLAHAFVVTPGSREWVQGALLRGGYARAYVLPGNTDCLGELLAHEREAMRQDLGLWRNAAYRIRWADDPARLMRLRNSFEVIEGHVVKVAVTRARIYLNFGTDWRSDFTAGAPVRDAAFGAQDVQALKSLEGKRVRVRGWIERRNGPYVELYHPGQVEVLDTLPASPGIAGHGRDQDRLDLPAGTFQGPALPGDPQTEDAPETKERPEPSVPGALDL
jgi:micrococcal nuclease